METIRLPRVMRETAIKEKKNGKSIGFVPTMGALHEGHLSLIKAARSENDMVVVSIFVNPAQFAAGEDFDKYPRTMSEDLGKLEALADIVFLPEKDSMYPPDFCTKVEIEGVFSETMCGPFRPGHFQGVATVVLKLFNIVQPSRAYFGQKDYQQAQIIKRLVKDMDLPLEVVVCPTLRESGGLALSSRNAYLKPEEKKAAAGLYRALQAGAKAVKEGQKNAALIGAAMRQALAAEPLISQVQYISVYDAETLKELEKIEKNNVILAGAVVVGTTRLIDNLLINDLK
ncbi:MAG: pantoate--beta-alanine ligase [Nitrospiraceae bacterium]|nr:pantoate--beta-alanine ligase [Nitrospiraceae bacterium]